MRVHDRRDCCFSLIIGRKISTRLGESSQDRVDRIDRAERMGRTDRTDRNERDSGQARLVEGQHGSPSLPDYKVHIF